MSRIIDRDGVKFKVTDDDDFWRSMWPRWETDLAHTIRTHCPEWSTFLDLGAWIGPWTLTAASLGRPVIALEPDPVAYTHLRANLALNRYYTVELHESMVANHHQPGTLIAQGIWGGSNSGRYAIGGIERHDIPTVTVADLLGDTPAFVKIDIEGDELDVFPDVAALGLPCHLSVHAGLPAQRAAETGRDYEPVDFRSVLLPPLARYGRLEYNGRPTSVDDLPWAHNFTVLCLEPR